MGWTTALTRVGLIVLTASASALPAEDAVEVRGRIEDDTVWRGRITITDDVIISDAVVLVESGTTIMFQPGDSRAARIILEGRRGIPTFLQIDGTEERPVVVRTAPGHPRGAILVPVSSTRPWGETEPMSIPHGGVRAVHAVFERLGDTRAPSGSVPPRRPAIHLQLNDPQDTLELAACRFVSCGPVMANFANDRCGATLTGCAFEGSLDDVAVELYGSGTGDKRVLGNRCDVAFRILVGPVLVADNLLAGPKAALEIAPQDAGRITVRGNYVHNTTARDTGMFCLQCGDPEAVVQDNLMIGGTWVIQNGSRKVVGNVLVGVSGLSSPKLSIDTTTHRLIATLPAGAMVSDNVLLGPAYSHVATTTGCRGLTIRRNVFDGGSVSGRAVHLNVLAREPVAAEIEDNVVVGFKRGGVYDEARVPGAVASCRGNVFADLLGPPYDIIGDGCDEKDSVRKTRKELNYPPLTGIAWDRIETELLSGTLTVQQAIRRVKARYPLPADADPGERSP